MFRLPEQFSAVYVAVAVWVLAWCTFSTARVGYVKMRSEAAVGVLLLVGGPIASIIVAAVWPLAAVVVAIGAIVEHTAVTFEHGALLLSFLMAGLGSLGGQRTLVASGFLGVLFLFAFRYVRIVAGWPEATRRSPRVVVYLSGALFGFGATFMQLLDADSQRAVLAERWTMGWLAPRRWPLVSWFARSVQSKRLPRPSN